MCVDLVVEKLPVLTPANVDTVRYYGRDGSSEIFKQLVSDQEDERYYNLALLGPPGTGKSKLVWAVAEHIASKKRQTVLWVSRRISSQEWTVRLFKPKKEGVDKGEVFEVKNCPKDLTEILKHEVAGEVDVVILDALSKANDSETGPDGMAAFNWTGASVNRRILKRRVIHVSSLGSFASKQTQRDSICLREIRMRTWTRQDFVEAVSDDKLKLQVCKTLGIDEPSTEQTPDRLVDAKFFYSGVNARWFFNLNITKIKSECEDIIERSSFETSNLGERHAFAVNSAVQSHWDDNRRVRLFTSPYVAYLMGQDKSRQTQFFELFPLMKKRLGNGSPGEIFESDFAMHLQHSHDLAAAQRAVMGNKAQKVDVRLGIDISTQKMVLWPTGRLHSLPKAPRGGLALPMPLTSTQVTDRVAQWFIPEDPSQPFLDFFVLIPEEGDKWQFRAIQNTVSKTHSTDTKQLQRVVGGVLKAGFDLADALVVAYVIEDREKQKTVAEDIKGTKIKVSNPAETGIRRQDGPMPELEFNIDLMRVVR